MLCAVGKKAVAENHSLLFDDNNTLLFKKLQEHLLSHYPTPESKRSPHPAVLKNLINDPGKVTLTALNNLHIFKCAECTRLLMELQQQKEQREASE